MTASIKKLATRKPAKKAVRSKKRIAASPTKEFFSEIAAVGRNIRRRVKKAL
jgi:hypothetical protein